MDSKLPVQISILIVTYNNASTISQCLESLIKQAFADYEILILDNASGDMTLKEISKYKSIVLFPCQKNTGFGAAMNKLAEKAKGEYLFMLNPDCVCPPDTLVRLCDFARAHPGAISPALVYPDGDLQLSARSFPSHKNILFSRRSPLFQLGLTNSADAGYLSANSPTKVPAVSATALFIGNKLFKQSGGFDERFFMYLEDIDLCRRLAELQIDIWYLPEVKISHVLGASSASSALKAAFYHHYSMFKYFTKHYPRNKIKNLILFLLLAAGLVASIALKILKAKRRK